MRGLPRQKSLSLWEQQRRPPPVAETGRSCWGRGQQDASESEADAGSRNPGSVTEGDGEGKPVKAGRRHSDRQALCQSDGIAVWSACCERPCPLRRSRASSPKGRALGEEGRPCGISKASPSGRAIEKEKRRRKLFAAKSASCLTRTGDTLINSQVL